MAPVNEEARFLWDTGLQTIKELEVDEGILASSKEEIYGCIFGRDSLITAQKLLRVYHKTGDSYFLGVVKKILLYLLQLQGKNINIESGEEPGKCIHEFRMTGHERLTKQLAKPWYVYSDNTMRNYDSADATSLLLITLYDYYALTRDEEFLTAVLPSIEAALDWITVYGDINEDGFVDYYLHPDRTFGGLQTQSWMDSNESVFHESGEKVTYPIAPVEVQAYSYLALRQWADYYKDHEHKRSEQLTRKADTLKRLFNEKFVIWDGGEWSIAFVLDGAGKPCVSARSSMGHALWAARRNKRGDWDTILDDEHIPRLVKRIMAPDLFEPMAGVRTLSTRSSQYAANSYHNGSIWPHDTSIIIEGLGNFGFDKEAAQVKNALLKGYAHFQTPIELFVFDNGLISEYLSESGQRACKKQAWSAAALLSEII
jgi:glycogen debranching enzyme